MVVATKAGGKVQSGAGRAQAVHWPREAMPPLPAGAEGAREKVRSSKKSRMMGPHFRRREIVETGNGTTAEGMKRVVVVVVLRVGLMVIRG